MQIFLSRISVVYHIGDFVAFVCGADIYSGKWWMGQGPIKEKCVMRPFNPVVPPCAGQVMNFIVWMIR